MIGAIFALSGMLLFMLAIMVTDFILLIQEEAEATKQAIGHDTKIYPDHINAELSN